MVGGHWDARNHIKHYPIELNSYELPQVLLDIFIDNEYFNEMAETFYNCNELYNIEGYVYTDLNCSSYVRNIYVVLKYLNFIK